MAKKAVQDSCVTQRKRMDEDLLLVRCQCSCAQHDLHDIHLPGIPWLKPAKQATRAEVESLCLAPETFWIVEIVVKNCASMSASRSLLYACPEETPLLIDQVFTCDKTTHALHIAPLLWCPAHLLLSHFPCEYVYCSSRKSRQNVIHRK